MADERGPCGVDGCERRIAVVSLSLCATHYARFRKHGTTDDSALVRGKNIGPCGVEGCDNPMRKTGLCAAHYSQKQRKGTASPFRYKWATELVCATCGREHNGTVAGRKYCSRSCQVLFSQHGGPPERFTECFRCGCEIDRRPMVPGGRWIRDDIRICTPCRRARNKGYSMSTTSLAARDGAICSICGRDVDMSLRRPERMSPSVDHVLPWSQGGTHDPENLALAHLHCNQVKQARIGFSLIAV